jgi:hypothetical protein
MNDNHSNTMSNQAVLAAMQAVDPSKERLLADRLALRQEVRDTKNELAYVQDVLVPRYIGIAKMLILGMVGVALVALILSLFKGLFDSRVSAGILSSFLPLILLIDLAERKLGRWELNRSMRPRFVWRRRW